MSLFDTYEVIWCHPDPSEGTLTWKVKGFRPGKTLREALD